MKRMLSALICLCLAIPASGYALGLSAIQTSTQSPDSISTADPDSEQDIADSSTLFKVAYMDNMLRELARQAYYSNEGWSSINDIADLWATVYSYINHYELVKSNNWETTDKGFVRIPADYMTHLFQDMYGVAFDRLPAVSRAYSSTIVYDAQSNVYDLIGADGENMLAEPSALEIGADGSVKVTYTFRTEYSDSETTTTSVVGGAMIYLEPTDVSRYGLKPVKVELLPEG